MPPGISGPAAGMNRHGAATQPQLHDACAVPHKLSPSMQLTNDGLPVPEARQQVFPILHQLPYLLSISLHMVGKA